MRNKLGNFLREYHYEIALGLTCLLALAVVFVPLLGRF
jgi:hypothetical protein